MDAQIDFIIRDLEDYTEGEIVRLGLNVDANLRASPPVGTPVDIGWARANWFPSVGEPKIMNLEKIGKPDRSAVKLMEAQRERGLNDLLTYRLTDGALFNTNNVVYITRLNDGHSPQQAAPGFVQRALELAVKQTDASAVQKRGRSLRAGAARAGKARPKP